MVKKLGIKLNTKQCNSIMPQAAPILLGETHDDPVPEKMLLGTLEDWIAQDYALCVELHIDPSELVSKVNYRITEFENALESVEKGDMAFGDIEPTIQYRIKIKEYYYAARALYLKCQQLNASVHCVDLDLGLDDGEDPFERKKVILQKQNEREEAMATRLFELYCQGKRVVFICGLDHLMNVSMKLTEKIKSLNAPKEYLPKAYTLHSSVEMADKVLSTHQLGNYSFHPNQMVILPDEQSMKRFSSDLIGTPLKNEALDAFTTPHFMNLPDFMNLRRDLVDEHNMQIGRNIELALMDFQHQFTKWYASLYGDTFGDCINAANELLAKIATVKKQPYIPLDREKTITQYMKVANNENDAIYAFGREFIQLIHRDFLEEYNTIIGDSLNDIINIYNKYHNTHLTKESFPEVPAAQLAVELLKTNNISFLKKVMPLMFKLDVDQLSDEEIKSSRDSLCSQIFDISSIVLSREVREAQSMNSLRVEGVTANFDTKIKCITGNPDTLVNNLKTIVKSLQENKALRQRAAISIFTGVHSVTINRFTDDINQLIETYSDTPYQLRPKAQKTLMEFFNTLEKGQSKRTIGVLRDVVQKLVESTLDEVANRPPHNNMFGF